MKDRIGKILILFFGLLYCGTFYPAFWTAIITGRVTLLIHVLFLGLWTVLVGIDCDWKFPKLNTTFNTIYITICAYFFIRLIFFQDFENLMQVVRLSIFYFDLFVTNAIIIKRKDIITKFIWFHVIMSCFTILGLILFSLGLLQPLGLIEISSLGEERLINFGFYFVKVHGGATELVDAFARPAGYYDEPGSFGLMVLLLLLYNKTHENNKRFEILLLIGGFASMSMAYIAAAVLYISLFTLNKKYIPFILSVICVAFLISSQYQKGKNEFADFIYARTIGRIELIRTGEDSSRNYKASFEAFADNWLVGESTSVLDAKYPNSTHETIWYYLAQNGVLGGLLLFLPLLYVFFRRGDPKNVYKKCILVLMVIIYQRPDYFQPLYLVIIYSSFYSDSHIPARYKKRKNNIITLKHRVHKKLIKAI